MAAAFFTYPNALTKYGSRDIGMPVMWKFSLPRRVLNAVIDVAGEFTLTKEISLDAFHP
jgi:hypothetical protein